MKKVNSKLLNELPLLFQRIEIKERSNRTPSYSGSASVRKLNSTKVQCENFDRPISKILVLTNEV